MTTLCQIELSCPICSIVRAAAARQAARDARRDTETVEAMYSLTPETVAAENRDAHDASVAEEGWYNAFISRAVRFNPGSGVGRGECALLTHQTSDRRVTRTRPTDNHSYSRCA